MKDNGIPIHLTKGYVAWVDPEDAHLVRFMWSAEERTNGRVYAVTRPGPRGSPKQYLHRIVAKAVGFDVKVDHKDGDGLNCRRHNLMPGTNQQNLINLQSKMLGVYRHKRKWAACISVGGKTKHLGLYATPEEANLVRLKAEMQLRGIQPRRRKLFEEAGLC